MLQQRGKRILALVFLVLVVFSAIYFRNTLNLEHLRLWVEASGMWAPVIFIAIYILATVLFLPGLIITISGGFIFGAWYGTLYNIIGAVCGASIAFFIARYLAHDWVAERTGKRLNRLMIGVKQEGWRFVALTRLVPLFPFNLLNYAYGLTPVKTSHYILASAIFMLPGTFAYTYVGSLGFAAIEGETRQIVTKGLIAAGLLILVSSLPWIIKKIRHTEE